MIASPKFLGTGSGVGFAAGVGVVVRAARAGAAGACGTEEMGELGLAERRARRDRPPTTNVGVRTTYLSPSSWTWSWPAQDRRQLLGRARAGAGASTRPC